jgi:F-type H+-transporting ATPase subunit b
MEFDATFLIAAISFIVFVFLMNKIFYAPILKIMQERQKFVEDNFNNARTISQETTKQTNYHDNELEKSRENARVKISEKSQQLKQERTVEISKYKEELSNNLLKEKEALKNSAIQAKETLKDSVVEIAKEVSEKLLGEGVNSELINKSQIKEEQD